MQRRRLNQSRGVQNETGATDDLFDYTQTPRAASVSAPTPIDDELWNVRTITAKTGLARSTIYAYIKQGLFPRQGRLGPGRVGWRASEVRRWIASR
ncbi:MAG: AlpA family phage regulatory protein [Rhodospirillales bacterium]|nr:AlpA family phage regulatory protein [Rhodospirillales bacterium]